MFNEKGYWLMQGDCLERMKEIPSGSVDMVLADVPYGTTACSWEPFTTALISSNMKMFKYEWIYEKTNPKGFLSARNRPLTAHENVCVFSNGAPVYYPQKWEIPEHLRTKRKHATSKTSGEVYGAREIKRWDDDGSRFPTSVIGFSNRVGRSENYHPTQKPVALMEYLIKTYTNEGETVMDFTCGSGTTGVACANTGRKFIGIELDPGYFNIALDRIEKALA